MAEESTSLSAAERLAKDAFGIEALRPGQREVIRAALEGRDAIAIMPTGSGKSLCYQVAGLHREGTTLVVSPLIALLKDQADKLAQAGVDVSELHSALPSAEAARAEEALNAGGVEFVLVTPERLATAEFRDSLAGHSVDLLVVDEAHCVSEWGHDFRPAYLRIRDAAIALGRPPVLALTATAPPRVREDIVRLLGMQDAVIVDAGIYRPNLAYEAVHVPTEEEKIRRLVRLLGSLDGQGIVYCATIRNVEQVVLELAGLDALPYHGRLSATVRAYHQDRFMSGDARVMVATNAFGLGVDKPGVRFVIHYDVPPSIEAYCQESGRAGRDGDPARCVLIYRPEDRRVPLFFLSRRYLKADDVRRVCDALGHGRAASWKDVKRDIERGVTKAEVALHLLEEEGWVERLDADVVRLLQRPDDPVIELMADRFMRRRDQDRDRLDAMVSYATTGRCRWQVLLEYFGESAPQGGGCGTCDNCRAATQRESERAGRPQVTKPQPVDARFLRGRYVEVSGAGRGMIEAVDDDRIAVRFPDTSTRWFTKADVFPS